MKQYKLETAIFHSKVSLDREHLMKSSELELQGILDCKAEEGWRLISTDATNFGSSVYFYLYFEKDAEEG